MCYRPKQPIAVDEQARIVSVPHLGVTLRTVMGAVLSAWTDPQPLEAREYTIHYKNAPVGRISVRQHADI